MLENVTAFSNESHTHHPPLHESDSPAARISRLIFLVLNAVVSLVGNSLSLAVFTRSRLRGAPSSGYLASLAVADTGSAVTAAMGIAMEMYGSVSTFFYCNVVFFLSLVFQFLAVWLLVCFTAERYVSVCHALRSVNILSKFREYRVVILLVVVPSAIYSPYLILTHELYFKTDLELWSCKWTDGMESKYEDPIIYVIFLAHFVLPMLVIGVLNTLIVHQLCKTSGSGDMGPQANKEREAENRSITITLFVVSLAFFLCHFPFNMVYLLRMLDMSLDFWVYRIFQTLFKVSYSTNFFLYALSGSQFRTSLKSLLGLNRVRNGS